MRKWLSRAYGTHHNTAFTARNDKNPTREFQRINPGPILLKTGTALNTVGESAMPDSKENKQADAGSRRFRRHFLCGAILCDFLSTEHEGLSTHVQREWSAEPFMPSILSLRTFCTAILSRWKFSPPTVCVLCFLPSHSGHQVRWTYQPRSHRRKVTQDLSSTFFLGCWCNVWLVIGLLCWRRPKHRRGKCHA